MARNGSGTYSLPSGNPVTTGTTISSTVQNNTLSDIATALTYSLSKDGQTVPTANLPMGGFKFTGIGDGSLATDSVSLGQVADGLNGSGTSLEFTQTGTGAVARTWKSKVGEVISVKDFGAVGDGVTDDTTAIQSALDSIGTSGGIVVVPAGTYLISDSLQVRKNNTTFDIGNATIKGPVAGTLTGELIAVCDRTDVSKVISNVTICGGVIQPQNAADNGPAVVSAEHVVFDNIRVNLATGLRGIVVQVDTTFTDATPIRDVVINNCFVYGGGTNCLNIESAGADNLINNVLVSNCVFKDATTLIRISGGGVSNRIYRIALNNIIGVAGAQDTTGMVIAKCSQVSVDGIMFKGLRGASNYGIQAQALRSATFSNVYVQSITTAGLSAIYFDDLTGNGSGVVLNGFIVDSTLSPGWTNGVYGAHDDLIVKNGDVRFCTNAINTNAGFPTIWDGIVAQDVTNLSNAYRVGDTYKGLMIRTAGTSAILSVDDSVQSPSVLASGDNNNYDPSNATLLYLRADAAGSAITGFSGGSGCRKIRLVNVSANNLTLKHANAGSIAANRIRSPTGANIVLGPDDCAEIQYDSVFTGDWRIISVIQ